MANNVLKREIKLWGLSANMVNIMVGAGIFVLPAIVAAGLGSAAIIAYLFCGILITLVMLCFAEVGSQVTDSGGVYAYIRTSFGKYAGFLTAMLYLLATISADAAISNAISDIFVSVIPSLDHKLFRIALFFFLFGGLALINVIGAKEGVNFVKLITAAKIIPLLLILLIGFKDVDFNNLHWDTIPPVKTIGEISLILFFAFQGSEGGLSVSGEVKNPKRTVPRAIFVSIFGVLVLYILLQTISQGILGDSLPTFKENPLAETAGRIFGPYGFSLITIGAAVSMFGALSSEILSMPRVVFAVSEKKVLPIKQLSFVHKKFATPYVAIIVYASMGFLFASFGGFEQLAIISSASVLMIYFGISIAVLKLRRKNKETEEKNSFKIPGGYVVPLLSAGAILWFLSNLSRNEFIGMGLFICSLTLIYIIINSKMFKKFKNQN